MYREISVVKMTARHAMGGLFGYYRSNQGTQYGVDFWEENMLKNVNEGLRKTIVFFNTVSRYPRRM